VLVLEREPVWNRYPRTPVDAAVDQNQAFYKFGRNLDINGNVAGDCSLWRGVPSWFAWENQGGGIAAIRHNGLLQMTVMMVDNPPEQNAGYYSLLPLEDNPARNGKWDLLGFHSGVLAVHAALLHTGKVLFFAGSGSSATRFGSADFGNMGKGIFTSVVWDPQAAPPNNFSHPPTIFAADHRPFDFFCGGDTFLPDGRVLSAGGTLGYNPFRGRADATVFDPQTETWKFVAGMTHGRWYPSLIALGDGRILRASLRFPCTRIFSCSLTDACFLTAGTWMMFCFSSPARSTWRTTRLRPDRSSGLLHATCAINRRAFCYRPRKANA
jgi:hypothetical protein